MMTKKLTLAGYIILAICFGFIIHSIFFKSQIAPTTNHEVSTPTIQTLFSKSFPDENGKIQNLKQWQGKIIVLNFYVNLKYQNKNVVVVGISTDDIPTVKKFTNETKVSYPLLAADMAGSDLAFSLGNDQDVLPYTVIIKPDGTVEKTFFGRLSMPKLEETLNKLF